MERKKAAFDKAYSYSQDGNVSEEDIPDRTASVPAPPEPIVESREPETMNAMPVLPVTPVVDEDEPPTESVNNVFAAIKSSVGHLPKPNKHSKLADRVVDTKGREYSKPIERSAPVEDNSDGGSSGMGRRSGSIASSSIAARYPHARELSQTFARKLYEMRLVGLATFSNCILIYYVNAMLTGIAVPISLDSVRSAVSVALVFLLLVSNLLTTSSLDAAVGMWFGYKITQPKGLSLAVCGFFQSPPFLKYSIASHLSLKSSIRKMFLRMSLLWILLFALRLLTRFCASAIYSEAVRQDSGTVDCITFTQVGSVVDRGWPTIQAEMGITEFVFGSAIGTLRSESAVDQTTFVMSPQIIGAVSDGDTIVGPGFTTTVSTSCQCVRNNHAGLVLDGLSSADATSLLTLYGNLNGEIGLASIVSSSDTAITVNSMLSEINICGGQSNTYVPLCVTKITNHTNANILVSYMTDGTTASIAPRYVQVRDTSTPADISTWLYTALITILGGSSSSVAMPSTIPSVMNPLWWWTTPNLISTDPSLVEGGIETLFSVLLRAGIQRTYNTEGESCVLNVQVEGSSVAIIQVYGFQISMFLLGIQLIICFGCLIAYIPWLLSDNLISPGVRVVTETANTMTMMSQSKVVLAIMETISYDSVDIIWKKLDTIVRVGEPVGNNDDVVGRLCLDKPKLVHTLRNGKKYY